MNSPATKNTQAVAIKRDSDTIRSIEDEIRVDQQCAALLKEFHRSLLEEQKLAPLEAGSLAAGADYFLRDFMIDNRRCNIFFISADLVRSFAGHWYIISNLEPNLAELTAMLKGTESFYRYCAGRGLVATETAEGLNGVCTDYHYYAARIEAFLDLTGDGFIAWEKDCPLG